MEKIIYFLEESGVCIRGEGEGPEVRFAAKERRIDFVERRSTQKLRLEADQCFVEEELICW